MTIGYNRLGSNGRFANQMFQYAGLRGVAAHRGFDFKVPPPGNYGRSDYALFECFEMGSVRPENFGFVDGGSIATGQFHFYQKFFDNCPDNVNLHDYFQTEKYFKHIRDEIKGDFEFKDEISSPCKDTMAEIEEPVSLHIRRTDYISNPNHSALGLEYYEKALRTFDKRSTIVVFSDDPDWCNEQELFASDRFLVAEGNVNYVDLCLMTLCTGHIIANSSFSWWGAWLSDSKKVVAPTNWFSGHLEDQDTNDLDCPDWEVM